MLITNEYLEGKRAFREGYGHDESPYEYGTQEHTDWTDGYEDAEGEDFWGDWQPDWFIQSR